VASAQRRWPASGKRGLWWSSMRVEGSYNSRETSGVRRRRLIEEWSSSEGAHRKGADDGDARAGSGAEEGLRWREAGEADAWVVGDECAALGRGRKR
jgi:hypothetical protein